MHMGVGERACFDFETVVPVATANTLGHIASHGESSRLPLPDDVAILMQHEPWVGEEFGGAASKVDAAAARRCDRPAVNAHEQGILDDAHMVDAGAEQRLECGAEGFRQGYSTSDSGHG